MTTPYLLQALAGHSDHLQEENSQLVAQNHRLMSELENTSQQLLHANSKVCCRFNFVEFTWISIQLGEMGEELAREQPAQSKVEMLEAQVRIMQDKLSKVHTCIRTINLFDRHLATCTV